MALRTSVMRAGLSSWPLAFWIAEVHHFLAEFGFAAGEFLGGKLLEFLDFHLGE